LPPIILQHLKSPLRRFFGWILYIYPQGPRSRCG